MDASALKIVYVGFYHSRDFKADSSIHSIDVIGDQYMLDTSNPDKEFYLLNLIHQHTKVGVEKSVTRINFLNLKLIIFWMS
jgi:hypothetical protein